MGKQFLHICWLTLSLSVLQTAGSFAQTLTPQPSKSVRNWTTVWDWATAPWNGDDKPYQQMRATIDHAVAGGRKPQELIDLYEIPALKAPSDPKAQFRWAYAAYKLATDLAYNQGENVLAEPRKALVLAPFPHTYEYARLIFLTEDYSDMFIRQLQPVSKRLLRRNSGDFAIKYGAAGNLMYSPDAADRQLALTYIEELIQERPERSAPRALLGLFYYRQWRVSRSKEDADKAISGYQQYLERASPVDAFFTQQVRGKISELQRG